MMQALGWTLIHFLWEGTLVALLLAGINLLLNRSKATSRYVAACAAMGSMVVAAALTFALLARHLIEHPTETGFANWGHATVAPATVPNLAIGLPGPGVPWLAFVVGAWAVGVLLLSVRTAGGLLLTRGLRREAVAVTSVNWQRRMESLSRRLKVKRVVQFCESARAQVTTTLGWLRPMVLVPAGFLLQFPADQIEALLAHELAHIRRLDYLVNIVQTVVETLFFYHPAVWWVSRRIRQERENCCDDIAVAVLGDPVAYAKALSDLDEIAGRNPELAIAASGGSLLLRVKRLIIADRKPGRAWLGGILASSVILGGLVSTRAVIKAMPQRAMATQVAGIAAPPASPLHQAPAPTAAELSASRSSPITSPRAMRIIAIAADKALIVRIRHDRQPFHPLGGVERWNAFPHASFSHARLEWTEPLIIKVLMPPFHRSKMAFWNAGMHSKLPAIPNGGLEWLEDRRVSAAPPSASSSQPGKADSGGNPQGNTGGSYIEMIGAAGYPNLSVDELIAFKTMGVTPEYLRGLRDEGLHPSAREVIAMRTMGVTPEYVSELRRAGYSNLSSRELIACRTQGVNPETVRKLNSLGFGKLTVRQLIRAQTFGMDTNFVRAIRQVFPTITFNEVISARTEGLTPEYIRDLREAGLGNLTVHEAVMARSVGVTPAFVREVSQHGFKNLSIEKLIELKTLGIFSAPASHGQ
jgi:beta-lactamase regulating signal transducer with metallopeptidase domain